MKDVGCERCDVGVKSGRVGNQLRGRRCQDDEVGKLGEERPCKSPFADIDEYDPRFSC